MEQNIGFIGLGAMGYPMAKNIRTKMSRQSNLWVYDVQREVCERFAQEFKDSGPISIANSAKEVAQNALTIATIVPTGHHVRQVYLGELSGVTAAKGLPHDKERLYLECSTIDMATARDVGQKLEGMGMGRYVDCPVSGGVPAAHSGTLSMLVGASKPTPGEAERGVSKRLQDLLLWMGDAKKHFYCGDLGSGLAAKICNNYLSCTILLANAEAMATGVKLGLDPKILYQVIANSTGQNFMCDHVCPVPGVVPHAPSSNGYKLGFKAQMLSKDVGLGIEAANSVNIKPSIGEAAIAVFDQVGKDERCIDHDASVVYRFLGGPE
ncbi:putative 3-hydroxyisobutyrate dehydrogenase [Mytilinidion resinicola]|uniref:3-hydroxyisobutyrate dehydrogenase n=1 Tax=Mytilinidion resinicola TaxID=574789 RepID=A0A6A6Z395_9PEZI|nr:putative 3-hydroxyisobutyrate dehydrogenase [Mytilinidion resinicola]KAF2815576.1 putative 3-hydroxyisobutyrate dehydrogenase [Mytilinidion resinicola]